MTMNNNEVLHQIDQVFEQFHLQLDNRHEQLVRQYKRHSRDHYSSTLSFIPLYETQLQQAIRTFGRLTAATSLNDIHRLTNSASIPNALHSISFPMHKASSTFTVKSANDQVPANCRIIGERGRQRGQLSNPQDVLFLPQSLSGLIVSDTINQNVQLFSLDSGRFNGMIGSSLMKTAPLRRPIGLAKGNIDDRSIYFVTDYDQHHVSCWTIDENNRGKFQKKFGQQSLIGPKGLCVSNSSNRVVVADNKGNSICLFDANGSLMHRFGTRGSQAHELAGPHYVRFSERDDDRLIFVTDFYNNSVKLFDLERHGQLVTSFGSIGTTDGLFQAPTGLAIDYERGYVFIADWGNNRIQIFDRQGTFLRLIDLSPSQLLYGPQGLDYDPFSRTLAIANSGKHCALLIHID